MKNIVASVGLVALGASGLQAASVSGITAPDAGKPWSVSATLRGFYDDNINSLPNDADLQGFSRESIGWEVSPAVRFAFPWEQTLLSLGYTYSYKYYENPLFQSRDHDDQTHQFNLALNHAFSERYNVSLKDSFVVGQEPDVLRAGNTMESFQRLSGDNLRNYGAVDFNGMMTRQVGYEIGYANTYFNYDQELDGAFTGTPSYSGLLDRVEHIIHLDAKWQMVPSTVGVVGYQFREIDYTGDEPISAYLTSTGVHYVMSDDRNAKVQYGYLGLDHTFRPDLSASLRAGASFVDYFNDPSTDSDVAPYVLANLKWTYMSESSLELGFTYDLNSTDQFMPEGDQVTMSAQSAVVYLHVNQKITPKLFGSLVGQFQNSSYNGGALDGEAEQFILAGLNLEYRFTTSLSAHAGYNYDLLVSDDPNREFDRNRIYIGLTASY